eukprot:CAMPEP_0117448838 /NCGR_PEP_ID=MMETSP0759-20121206/7619_1 /TAXON_ID=63605 /ORGANISM="Percolomonas cosmopolitus, Strain WS" /LENGTH=433 /DNA_ID=CAMNT_0005241261 /DNA_START=27 /DNA_END=1328 /DNA_ORIENTATION=+
MPQSSNLTGDINISSHQDHSYLRKLVAQLRQKVQKDVGTTTDASCKKILFYGANGYTASIILHFMSELDFPMNACVFAARNPAKLTEALVQHLGEKYGRVMVETFAATDKDVERVFAKRDYSVVLNCAGPFEETADAFIKHCASKGVSYVDITGEVSVFESVLQNPDLKSKIGNKKIVVMPGVGFDIVPSDSLLKSVTEEFEKKFGEKPNKLEVLISTGGNEHNDVAMSHGTKKTMLRGFASSAPVTRLDGKLQHPKEFVKDFKVKVKPDDTQTTTVRGSSIPWGDVSTGYFSTGVPNIHTYMPGIYPNETTAQALNSTLVSLLMRFLFALPFVLRFGEWCIENFSPKGPSENSRTTSRGVMLAEATSKDGSKEVKRMLYVPEGYHLTAQTALASTIRIALGDCKEWGPTTPSRTFGSDYIVNFDGCFFQEAE